MSDLTKLTIAETRDGLKKRDFTATEVVSAYIKAMESNRQYNAYVLETPEIALEQAKASDRRYADGTNGALEGIPLGIKDLFCTKGIRTTACSHILDGFVPQYESTVTGKLLSAGAAVLGKLNMDEFAMGGSNETSYYGPAVNPWSKNEKLVAGGSSGGSAAACHRNRYRRVDPPTVGFLRRDRNQTDLRPLLPLRHYCFCFFSGPGGADCQRCPRCGDYADGDVRL